MATSKLSTIVDQFHCGETARRTWKLKDWNRLHNIMTSEFSCPVNIGNAVLRFFLQPLNLKFKTNETAITMKYYSLWVELLSKPMERYFLVRASTISRNSQGLVGNRFQGSGKHNTAAISENTLKQFKTVLVSEKFIYMTTDYTNLKVMSLEEDPTYVVMHHECTPDLDINIAVTLCTPGGTKNEPQNVSVPDAQRMDVVGITSQMKSLLLNPEFQKLYDVQLKMKDNNVLQAHKIILAAGSPVFLKMLTSEMRETTENLIEIPDIGSQAMNVVLHFIYTNEVDEKWKEVPAEMVYAAAKYDLPKLLEYLNDNMITACNNNNVVELFRVAKLHNLENAMRQLTEYTRANTTEVLLGMDTN